MNSSTRAILFFGPQGAGKGTQKQNIANWLSKTTNRSVLQIELGDFFRTMMKTGGRTQDLVKEVQNQGKLQPDFLAVYAVVEKLISSYSGEEHLILDGFPRNDIQVQIFQQLVEFYGLTVDVVSLELSEEESIKRLLARGRDDDNEAAITERLSVYQAETKPLLSHFESAGQYAVHRIDGKRTIEEVTESVIASLTNAHRD